MTSFSLNSKIGKLIFNLFKENQQHIVEKQTFLENICLIQGLVQNLKENKKLHHYYLTFFYYIFSTSYEILAIDRKYIQQYIQHNKLYD